MGNMLYYKHWREHESYTKRTSKDHRSKWSSVRGTNRFIGQKNEEKVQRLWVCEIIKA